MGFGAGDGDLSFLAKSQDIVPEDVLFPVMLVDAAVAHVINEVIFQEDAGAGLIRIEPPPSVARRVDLVNDVVANDCAFRWAERVNAAHIAQNAIPQVMEMVVLNPVYLGGALVVTPPQADTNGRVKPIA